MGVLSILLILSRFERMISIWELANPQLRDLAAYEPGRPIEETARDLGVTPNAIVKLASNENPLGPSPQAVEAMRVALENAHLYPDGGGLYLCRAIAAKLGLAPENIILGNGSNEAIEFLGHAFLKLGDDVITSQYAFIVYKLLATSFGARTIEVPSPDYQQDLQAILRYVQEGRNIVVLRTFSKIHGLAGLRIGYGVARPELIDVLQKTRQPFNVNSIAHAGALAALKDDAHLRETKRVVAEGRAYLQDQFIKMKIQFVRAVANFVMVNMGDGPGIFKKLLARKVIVRPLKGYKLPEWVRISVGTMEQNRACIAVLREILSKDRRV